MNLNTLPVIAIVGRPNVGKSTLFNRFTRTKDAIVADVAGLTRDRQYGEGRHAEQRFIVVDTGGIGEEAEAIDSKMTEQSKLAIVEADCVLFLVDGRAGLSAADSEIVRELRGISKPVYLVVNKTDGLDPDIASSEFFRLGLGEPHCIAASHGRGVHQLLDTVLDKLPTIESDEEKEDTIKLAIVGRPNVGKSTLVNRMLGEERVVVFDMPGTTRDSLFIPMERQGQHYTLIDTAGVRRRSRVEVAIEKFSVIKTLQAVEAANVAIVVLDAQEGVTDQDLHLISFVIESGRALVLAFNKWDGLEEDHKTWLKNEIQRRCAFTHFARHHYISALHGTGVGNLFDSVQEAYQSARQSLSTSRLTRILQDAVANHQPPQVGGHRIKLRYAHPGGHNPPVIVIHGNQTDKLPPAYERYLNNVFYKSLKLKGTPLRFQFKTSDNPYQGRKNQLTVSQERKRKRFKKYLKKSK